MPLSYFLRIFYTCTLVLFGGTIGLSINGPHSMQQIPVQEMKRIKTADLKALVDKHRVVQVTYHNKPLVELAATATPAPEPTPNPIPETALYVKPGGSGSGTKEQPFGTLQQALNVVKPGDTVVLLDGVYTEQATTKTAGTVQKPITIMGSETGKDPAQRHKAVLTGTSRILSVDHSFYTFKGFTIDGEPGLKNVDVPEDATKIENFKASNSSKIADSKGIYIGANSANISGITITDMFITRTGGEAVRFRNNATESSVDDSLITLTGMYGKEGHGYRWHNGEGIYIGTSPKSTDQPYAGKDASNNIRIKNNTIRTFASESVNLKELAHHCTMEDNDFGYSMEVDPGGAKGTGSIVEIRGHDCVLTNNKLHDGKDIAVKVKSDDAAKYPTTGNTIADNQITNVVNGPGVGGSGGGDGPSPAPIPTPAPTTDSKEIMMELVSSAENSSLNWKAQYGYIEDINDGRGYTAGIVGFCSGTGDMLDLVKYYQQIAPANILVKYLPALTKVNGSDLHTGLGDTFVADWKAAAKDPLFQQAQNHERDRVYYDPAIQQAKADGLRTLGQFIYYDALVMHGPGDDGQSFGGIRNAALAKAKTPAQGGDETTYLNAFLDARTVVMKAEEAHADTSRIDTAQRVFVKNQNFDLKPPLNWAVYGDEYQIP
jgi:chitosanase